MFIIQKLLLCLWLCYQVKFGSAEDLMFVFENEEVFTDCPNQPKNVLGMNGLADFSELNFGFDEDIVRLSGNTTFVWNINAKHRIQLSLSIFKFNRGSWQSTLLNMKVPDFCKDMYNPELVWYKYWTKYALNAAEVRNQCALPGVKLIYEPFNIDVAFSVSGTLLSGRHKIVITMEAIDPMYKKAAQSICFEMIGAIFEQS